jgi:hypothetical protein
MKKPRILVGMLVAGLLLAPFIVPVFVPWSEINCECQEMNIKTGQARYSRRLWFVTMSERIDDTPLSLALQGETVDVADISAWHRVNTFSPGVRHSPHYLFHGALHQAGQFEMIATMSDLNPDRRREVAKGILTAWQQTGRYNGADEYIRSWMEEGASGN